VFLNFNSLQEIAAIVNFNSLQEIAAIAFSSHIDYAQVKKISAEFEHC